MLVVSCAVIRPLGQGERVRVWRRLIVLVCTWGSGQECGDEACRCCRLDNSCSFDLLSLSCVVFRAPCVRVCVSLLHLVLGSRCLVLVTRVVCITYAMCGRSETGDALVFFFFRDVVVCGLALDQFKRFPGRESLKRCDFPYPIPDQTSTITIPGGNIESS